MKLSAAQLSNVEAQLGATAVSDDHPIVPDLRNAFGDHTFFLDAAGLNIVEPNPSLGRSSGKVVKLASWGNKGHTELLSHKPEVLTVTVDFQSNGSDPAA